MPIEDGVLWKPLAPEARGRHRRAASAFDAAFTDLTRERNPFFDSLADRWAELFPGLPLRPGRAEGGRIYVYARNVPTAYAMRPKLRRIAARLASLPGAPAKVDLRLEVHVS